MTQRSMIAAKLREIAGLLELQAGNRYKVRAYQRGAGALEASTIAVEDLIEQKKLENLPGIGEALAKQIEEIFRTGSSALLESLKDGNYLELKKVNPNQKRPPIRLYDGLRLGDMLRTTLAAAPGVSVVTVAGGVAEALEMSPSLDLVVTTSDPAAAVKQMRFAAVESETAERAVLRLADGTAIHLMFGPPPAADTRANLISQDDIRGFVHCHSTWSDGKDSIEDMARAAAALGAEFITITDHSKTAHYAGGLDEDRIRAQWDEIDEVQEKVDIKILKGTEADILADGAIDWPDAILEKLDVIVASIHNRYRQDEAAMTKRVLRAMRWPGFKIWGHPLGRLVPQRPPIPLRVEEVLDAVAESNGAIEINGDPYRMDLEPRWAKAARERGLSFVLSVDAHSTGNLDFLRTAVALARRAGIEKGEVLNTKSAAAFAKAVRPRPVL